MKGGKEIRNRNENKITPKACGSSLLRYKASVTIEAALCVPLMISALVMLMMPLKIFDERRKLQSILEAEVKNISSAAYAASISDELINTDADIETNYSEYKDILKLAAVKASVLSKIDKNIFDNISFGEGTSVLSGSDEDKAIIRLDLDYDIRLPINLLNTNRIKMSSVVNRRAFIGSKGGRGRLKYSDEAKEENVEEDIIVYVGKNRSRYHLRRDCHYISNDMRSAEAADVLKLNNLEGRKYKPCTVCKPGKTGIVYYFENGVRYHSIKDCKSLASYVEAVPLSQVKHLGVCLYCGKK